MEKVYYFDNAATTFPKHENVYKAMDEANRDYAVNAGRGAYALARKASEVISETRQQIMELTETENVAEVVFTASATLACNEIFGSGCYAGFDVYGYYETFTEQGLENCGRRNERSSGECVTVSSISDQAKQS